MKKSELRDLIKEEVQKVEWIIARDELPKKRSYILVYYSHGKIDIVS